MDNIKRGFINIQLFAEDADGNGAETPKNDAPASQPTINYEEEYKKQLLELDKLRESIKKSNSENAEYKRKEREKMTEQEKSAQEYKELVERNKELQEQLARVDLEKKLLTKFSAEETAKLIESNCDSDVYAQIFEERAKALEKTFKAEAIKNTTPSTPIGNATSNSVEKTKAQQLAEKKFGVDTSKIKDFYKKA